MRTAFGVLLFTTVFLQTAFAGGEAYLGAWSGVQGQPINVYVSSDDDYTLELKRVGIADTLVWSGGPYPGGLQPIPADAYSTPLNWQNPVAVPIAYSYPSSVYRLKVTFADGSQYPINFVVRENNPGSTSPILVLDNATTRIAYNEWGGKSAYKYNSSQNDEANSLSLYRPDQHGILPTQKNFLRWAEQAGIPLEWASTIDWHNDPDLFANYETIVLVRHSEYWTRDMRNQMDAHLAAGGNLLSMSGNTAWWQIRIENDQMIIYKDAAEDPLFGVQNHLVASNFFDAPVNDPENSTTGVSYAGGGLHNRKGYYMHADGYGGYSIRQPSHPLFAGTGLADGDQLGQQAAIVGDEVDGAQFTLVGGKPVVTGADGTPTTLEIIATAPAKTDDWDGTATFVAGPVGENGGQLINMATVFWANGLWDDATKTVKDPLVGRVTLNAIKQLSPGAGAQCSTNGCHESVYNDADNDGIDDKCDTCVAMAGPMLDSDNDGTGNICEAP